MNFRLKTSKKSMEILKELQGKSNYTPNYLARLAISLSLLEEQPPEEKENDTYGLEFNRHTLTGNIDGLYKILMAEYYQRSITDEEFFPHLVKIHLERGIKLLENEYNYSKNAEKFIINLTTLEPGVLR